jgi:hypothetical protein
MSEFTYKDLGKTNFTQDDGAVWTAFFDKHSPDKRFLIVTSVGRELFLDETLPYRVLKRLVQAYRSAESGSGHPSVRDFLGQGQQARVFGLSRFAVRETGGIAPFYPSMSALDRMNKLSGVVEGGVPRWINVPRTYAFYSDPQTNKQYTLMDRLDSGVTVEDVTAFDEVSDHSRARVLREYGHQPTAPEVEDAHRLFDKAHRLLTTVIGARGHNPEEILTDWKARNVIIEPLSTPVGGERYLLNVIDQN